MSPSHPRIDDMEVVLKFTEALKQRVGDERFQMWFGSNVRFQVDRGADGDASNDSAAVLSVLVGGQFALDRLKKNFLSEIRGASTVAGSNVRVELKCEPVAAQQTELPLDENNRENNNDTDQPLGSSATVRSASTMRNRESRDSRNPGGSVGRNTRSRRVQSLQHLADQAILGQTRAGSSTLDPRHQTNRHQTNRHQTARIQKTQLHETSRQQTRTRGDDSRSSQSTSSGSRSSGSQSSRSLSSGRSTDHTMETFLTGPCNTLAHTAAMMVCNDPGSNALVYFSGPSGVGKSHLLTATADHLRRRYRMRGVIQMSAEQFTNEFIAVVGKTGITDFRTRYRDVDALLIDDVHFFAKKTATIRELIHTIGSVQHAGKLIIFAGNAAPHEVDGFTSELAGRLSSGLVCSMSTLDFETRKRLMMRWISTRCTLAIEEKTIDQINDAMIGDGRAISGVVNVINLMQRMNHRTPTFAEIRQQCGHLLRGAGGEITMSAIEVAVSDAFGLEDGALRSGSQTRRVAQPRMLAMFLSRQKTSSAYTEIARHFNVKSHSTAMAAEKNVSGWLTKETLIGRGAAAVPAAEAIARVERLLSG